MMNSIGRHYLQGVLGWKNIPSPLFWPQADFGPVASTEVMEVGVFAVYAPKIIEEDRALLQKMMAAIGIESFDTVSAFDGFSSFHHILCFTNERMDSVGDTKLWRFEPLEAYREGVPQALNMKKRQAWEQLQAFKKEVL